MKKKILVIIFIFILILFVLLGTFLILNNDRGMVTIKNISGKQLNNVELIYPNSNDVIQINILNNNEVYKHKLKTDVEQSLILVFKDENGNKYSKDIVGYIYKGLEYEFIDKINIEKDYTIKITS